jgi:DNA-binding beta-propeller fold protein YncE
MIYLLIVVLFGIIFYQITFSCCAAYSDEIELKSIKQLGLKGSGEGQFTFPHSLAVDNLGNIYVGDTGNKRVQKFSPNGTFLTSWGSEGSGDGQFMGLHDISVDPQGKFVYTVELKNHRVQKFYTNGSFVTKWVFNGTGGRDVMRSPHQIGVIP